MERTQARRRYQQRVGSLLKAIDKLNRRQLALAVRGVTRMGMRELEEEIQALRDELAAVIAAGSSALGPEAAPQELPTRRRRRERISRTPTLRPVAMMHSAAHS
jgi:hypothetical protein